MYASGQETVFSRGIKHRTMLIYHGIGKSVRVSKPSAITTPSGRLPFVYMYVCKDIVVIMANCNTMSKRREPVRYCILRDFFSKGLIGCLAFIINDIFLVYTIATEQCKGVRKARKKERTTSSGYTHIPFRSSYDRSFSFYNFRCNERAPIQPRTDMII